MANLRITELDFDDIKTNLRTFLQSQEEFSDYDFTGSSLNVLLDVLAYNTHYNAYLANMLVNEMFLDSAVKRSSVVSLAKMLGYTPTSARSAKAIVDVVVNGVSGSPSTITLPRYSEFSTVLSSNTYSFYNVDEIIVSPNNGTYEFTDVEIYEGTLVTFSYVVNNPGPEEKYVINDTNIDSRTLRVTVQNSSTDQTSNTYTLSTDTTALDGTSKVYFLEENSQEKYEIYFGDGIVGKKLSRGNIVIVQYLVSSGTGPNSSASITQSFALSATIEGSTSFDVSTTQNSIGASEKENIFSIKYNAPKVNASRNRAVTADDYKSLIQSNFTEAESISVWGGEDNVPPAYGKVFISLKPFDGYTITEATKANLNTQILRSKKVLAIQPEFVDPEYFYLNLNVNIQYNTSSTTLSSNQITSQVTTTINNYFNNELKKFDKDFNKSKLIKQILDTNSSISTVLITVKVQKRYNLTLNTVNSFTGEDSIQFNNKITPGSVSSSRFNVLSGGSTVLVRAVDIPDSMPPNPEGTGTLRLVRVSNGQTVDNNFGTVNYSTGSIAINQFTPVSFPTGIRNLRITASIQELSHNIQVFRNQIIVKDDTAENKSLGLESGLTVTTTAIVE